MSSADPRRPEKVQAYKPVVAGSGGNPGEDLTPDYMNILGPESTTGVTVKSTTTGIPEASSASNIIPTSPQYGVTIIPSAAPNDVPIEVNTQPVDTITDSLPKTLDENKDVMHSTPSKNDRFKVVKIASSEPFRRGRWKCMDYVDQSPNISAQQIKGITSQSQQIASGGVYMQTQSLPPQQIQQLLLQSGFTTTTPQQFYQNQMVPQGTQFFYQPHQLISGSVPAQFVTAGQSQQYFTTPVVPQNFQNVQFVQPYQSAFVPTTQQYQHQPAYTTTQTVAHSQPQPVLNGFTYTPHSQANIVSETKPIAATSELQTKTDPIVPTADTNPPTTTQSTDVYTNPQFVASVHSLPVVESEIPASSAVLTENPEGVTNPDDPSKTNPVVNAIDNKIEQAMDLVKSHLMYTVREEVEVLKEKIAELMERIQQLESENNFLRSQLPKNISSAAPSSTSEPQPPPPQAQ